MTTITGPTVIRSVSCIGDTSGSGNDISQWYISSFFEVETGSAIEMESKYASILEI